MAPLTAAAQSGMAEAVRLCLAAAPGGAAAAAKRQFFEGRTALFSAVLAGRAFSFSARRGVNGRVANMALRELNVRKDGRGVS